MNRKLILILSGIAVFLFVMLIILVNTDFYINKTSVLKYKKDRITCTKAEYESKYSNNLLNINFKFYNINEKSLKLAKNLLKEDEPIIKFQLSDKNSNLLFEIPILINDLDIVKNGEYIAAKTVKIDKKIIKKTRYTYFSYKIPICNSTNGKSLSDKNTIVVYYSNSGNTKNVANFIRQLLQCDIAEIKSEELYNQKNILELKNLVWEQIKTGYVPKINNIDLSGYEVIFVGSPVWKSHLSLPVKSFLVNNDFKDKTIIPFYTFGGKANKEQLDNEIKNYSHGAGVSDSFLTVWNGVAFLEYRLIQWLNQVYL